MSVGLTILLVVVAWALGPLILPCAGGIMTTTAALLWAIPMRTHTSATALILTAVSCAAMWHTHHGAAHVIRCPTTL
jgi:predicted RND superfamily exporter protein